MRRVFFLITVILIAISASGQNSYYETDNVFVSGVKVIEGKNFSNFHTCRIYSEGKFTEYTPYQVKRYGLKDGPEFFARDIEISGTTHRVFLELLTRGKATLFYFGDKQKNLFFLEKDSLFFSLIPDNHKRDDTNLSAFLAEISADCPELGDATGSVKYNRLRLSKFIDSYNSCTPLVFPEIRYGLMLGVGARKLVPSQNMSERALGYFDFNYEGSFIAGAFVNIPVLVSDFSVQIELFYNKTSFSYTASTDEVKYDFQGDIYALKMPLMLRYTHPSQARLRPFVNAGLAFEYNIKNNLIMYQESLDGQTSVIPQSDYSDYVKNMLYGVSAGGGVEYKLSPKHSVFLELRYDYLSGVSAGSFLNSSELSLITGIIF